ncbi:MAG TPA: hypothetical protein DCR55_06845 [Lentisphaeria bacterium]|jgi:chlorite dismutase|nr:hypothetical protein [Lentisphaeria bacterium]
MAHPGFDPPDISEKGRDADGDLVSLDRRLFVSLTVFEGQVETATLVDELRAASFASVLYADAMNPHQTALLTWSEDPGHFVTTVRSFVANSAFRELGVVDEQCLMGRTYTQGYETNPIYWLLEKMPRTVTNADAPWAIWYPLRRTGAFALLKPEEQRKILMEHGMIGRSFAAAGYAADVRLASYGLDRQDNDFMIGLIGSDLHPLSAVVQRMRSTVQTSEYIAGLGPFFVGRVVWQSKVEADVE